MAQRIAAVEVVQIATEPLAGHDPAMHRWVVGGIAEQDARDGGYRQTMRLQSGNGHVVANAAIDHLRLDRHHIQAQWGQPALRGRPQRRGRSPHDSVPGLSTTT
ncbi:hypothetical protein D3C78_1506110 [compost metagenome]